MKFTVMPNTYSLFGCREKKKGKWRENVTPLGSVRGEIMYWLVELEMQGNLGLNYCKI